MALRDKDWVLKRMANGVLIPWERLVPPSLNQYGNVRPTQDINKETVAQRANSLVLEGQRAAVTGYLSDNEESFELTDGEIRYHAWKYAKDILGVDLGGVYCVPGEKLPKDKKEATKKVVYFQIRCGSNTEPLSFSAKSAAVKKLKDAGESTVDIAKNLGCSDQQVRNLLRYAEEVDDDIKDAVNKGSISHTAAVKTARARKETQEEVKEKVNRGEKVKGSDIEEDRVLSHKDIMKQIKKAEKTWNLAKSEKERNAWAGVVKGLKITVGLEEKL